MRRSRVGMCEDLERVLGDVKRIVGREPREAGHLPLHGLAERDAELERVKRRALEVVAGTVRAAGITAVARVAEEVLLVPSVAVPAAGVVVHVLHRARPHLHAVHVDLALIARDIRRDHVALFHSGGDEHLAVAVRPAVAVRIPAAVPRLAQALRVERVVGFLVVAVLVGIAEPVVPVAVVLAPPADAGREDDQRAVAAAVAAAGEPPGRRLPMREGRACRCRDAERDFDPSVNTVYRAPLRPVISRPPAARNSGA